MIQSEQQLTSEEREALPGFTAPTPRRVRRKAHWRHDPWGWLECYRPFLVVIFIVAGVLGALSYFFPVLLGSVTVLLVVFFVLGGGLAALLLPQSFNGHFGHVQLVQSGQVAVGTVMSIEKKYEYGEMGESVDYVIFYEFQTVEGKLVKGERTSGWLSCLQEGGPILIVYLPDDPSQNEPFLNLTHEPVQTE